MGEICFKAADLVEGARRLVLPPPPHQLILSFMKWGQIGRNFCSDDLIRDHTLFE